MDGTEADRPLTVPTVRLLLTDQLEGPGLSRAHTGRAPGWGEVLDSTGHEQGSVMAARGNSPHKVSRIQDPLNKIPRQVLSPVLLGNLKAASAKETPAAAEKSRADFSLRPLPRKAAP